MGDDFTIVNACERTQAIRCAMLYAAPPPQNIQCPVEVINAQRSVRAHLARREVKRRRHEALRERFTGFAHRLATQRTVEALLCSMRATHCAKLAAVEAANQMQQTAAALRIQHALLQYMDTCFLAPRSKLVRQVLTLQTELERVKAETTVHVAAPAGAYGKRRHRHKGR